MKASVRGVCDGAAGPAASRRGVARPGHNSIHLSLPPFASHPSLSRSRWSGGPMKKNVPCRYRQKVWRAAHSAFRVLKSQVLGRLNMVAQAGRQWRRLRMVAGAGVAPASPPPPVPFMHFWLPEARAAAEVDGSASGAAAVLAPPGLSRPSRAATDATRPPTSRSVLGVMAAGGIAGYGRVLGWALCPPIRVTRRKNESEPLARLVVEALLPHRPSSLSPPRPRPQPPRLRLRRERRAK